jgi:hypothetical protein
VGVSEQEEGGQRGRGPAKASARRQLPSPHRTSPSPSATPLRLPPRPLSRFQETKAKAEERNGGSRKGWPAEETSIYGWKFVSSLRAWISCL